MIEIGKLPLVYLVPRFPPPSHLTGRPHVEGSPEMKLDLMAEDDDLRRLHEELGANNSELSLVFEWAAFSKLIAKVAHAHAVGVLGLDGVEFYLQQMIVGDHTLISKFVGGCSDPQYELPPGTDLALALIRHGNDVLVVVRTTFFGAGRFPVYEAVVGRVTDAALISSRLKAQSSSHS